MNKCNLVRDLLPLYVDDALSEDSRAFVERHLKTCPSCAGEAEKLKAPVPEEKALAALRVKKEQEAGGKKHKEEPIRKIKRRFLISTIAIALAAACVCGACAFALAGIGNEIARKEALLRFDGWEETEGIIRTISAEKHPLTVITDSKGHNESGCDLCGEKTYYEYTATPYQRESLNEEDDLLITFRIPFPMTGKPEGAPFSFRYIHEETGIVYDEPALTFKRNYFDVSEVVTRYSFPRLYQHLEQHPELYDPVQFVRFVLSYDYSAVGRSSSDEEIAFANELRRTTSIYELWGIKQSDLHRPTLDRDGIPILPTRTVTFIDGTYNGYAIDDGEVLRVVLSVDGELWEFDWDYPYDWEAVPGDWEFFPIELAGGVCADFIYHLTFTHLG